MGKAAFDVSSDKGTNATKKSVKKNSEKVKKNENKETVVNDTPAALLSRISLADPAHPRLRFFSWNVNGARALMKKEEASDFLASMLSHPELMAVGVQEIKCCEKDLIPPFKETVDESLQRVINSSTTKKGYSGTWCAARKTELLDRVLGMNNGVFDGEGRCITLEFDKYYFVTVYVPNASAGLKRLGERCDVWEKEMRDYLKGLDVKKPVIYCGDLNVACSAIELANPKSNYDKSAGYTQREIDAFDALLAECQLVDAYRHLYPENMGCYTYWGYRFNARARNIGWRMDYFLLSKRLLPALVDVNHYTGVLGSDHCPVELVIDPSKIV